MNDFLREEEIVNKVGGRYKLTTLIQQRMIALNAGADPLVSRRSTNNLDIVIDEILADKIYLDTSTIKEIDDADRYADAGDFDEDF